jgi:hypothetical protein
MLSPLKDYYYLIEHGPSIHCAALLREVENMTEGEGNYHFCRKGESALARKVMKTENESGRVIFPPERAPWLGHNHQRRCSQWFATYKKEWEKAGVKTSADIRKLEESGRSFPTNEKVAVPPWKEKGVA